MYFLFLSSSDGCLVFTLETSPAFSYLFKHIPQLHTQPKQLQYGTVPAMLDYFTQSPVAPIYAPRISIFFIFFLSLLSAVFLCRSFYISSILTLSLFSLSLFPSDDLQIFLFSHTLWLTPQTFLAQLFVRLISHVTNTSQHVTPHHKMFTKPHITPHTTAVWRHIHYNTPTRHNNRVALNIFLVQ